MSRIFKTPLYALLAATALMNVTLALAAPAPEELAESLAVNGEPMPVESVSETPLEGLFEVRLEGGETFYSDAKGEHFIVGDLYANREQGLVNLTQQSRNTERAERLAEIPEDRFVVFRGAEEPKAVIHVFTDATCPYCRKLHEEVPRLNEMGIEVRYLAFPRSGLNSQGARLLKQVWCADNSSEAMNAAKRGETLDAPADCDNPVAQQYHLGGELGVRGTPAIIFPDGRLVPGYVPAERLAAMLGVKG